MPRFVYLSEWLLLEFLCCREKRNICLGYLVSDQKMSSRTFAVRKTIESYDQQRRKY